MSEDVDVPQEDLSVEARRRHHLAIARVRKGFHVILKRKIKIINQDLIFVLLSQFYFVCSQRRHAESFVRIPNFDSRIAGR